MALDERSHRPTEPIHLPWRAANELYSGNVTNFFHAMDLVEQQCQQERAILEAATRSETSVAGHVASSERFAALARYTRAACEARRIYAQQILAYDLQTDVKAAAIRQMRALADRPHLPHDANMTLIADALESGDYTTLAL